MKGLWLLLLASGAAEAHEPRFLFYVLAAMREAPGR
jgi:hypothetical protein